MIPESSRKQTFDPSHSSPRVWSHQTVGRCRDRPPCIEWEFAYFAPDSLILRLLPVPTGIPMLFLLLRYCPPPPLPPFQRSPFRISFSLFFLVVHSPTPFELDAARSYYAPDDLCARINAHFNGLRERSFTLAALGFLCYLIAPLGSRLRPLFSGLTFNSIKK